MTQVYGTTLPATTGSGGGGGPSTNSFPDVEHILFVDKGTVTGLEDGSQQNPFHTVEDALAAAVLLTPAVDNQVAIYVYPGIYTENNDIELEDYTHLVGMCRDACIVQRTVVSGATDPVLYVTGDHSTLWNLTFMSVTPAYVVHWDTGGAGGYCAECNFVASGGSGSEFCFVDGDTGVTFVDCGFGHADSTDAILVVSTTGSVVLDGCRVVGRFIILDGDVHVKRSDVSAGHGTSTISCASTDDFFMADTRVANTGAGVPLSFGAEPSSLRLVGNRLMATTATYDIEVSSGTITGAEVQGNTMVKGMDGNISVASLERWSTGQSGDLDYYAGVLDAAAAVDQDDVVIRMLDDEAITSVIPALSYDITLDLRGHYIYDSAGGEGLVLAVYTAGVSLTLCNGSVKGYINLRSTASFLMRNIHLTGSVLSVSTYTGVCTIDRCHIEPTIRTYGIRITGNGPTHLIRRSIVRGRSGVNTGAILLEGGSPTKVYAKYSTFSNGDGTNEPFKRAAAETMTGAFYQCGFNAALPAWVTNNIAAGQENNSVDVDTNFV